MFYNYIEDMQLGNSNGKNAGKKYFIRSKVTDKPKEINKRKAALFNIWFEENYTSLVNELIDKNIYDCDTLNETYLRIYEIILYTGLEMQNTRSYFIRAYFTNNIQESMKENRYRDLPQGYDCADLPADYSAELEYMQRKLEEDIFSYVYQRYTIREFELFKMYMYLKPAVNYAVLADITNMKAHQIQFVVSKIKKDLCAHREFAKRRREVM